MGLHCNWQKTKVQNVGAGPAPPPVQMENQLVKSVTKFTYLGSDVVSGSSSTREVHRCIGLANSIVGQLDGIWRNRRLSLNTKLRLYTSLVQSVLLHGSETWTLTKADTARLQAFDMKAQRRILNIKWHDFVTNDSVRSQTKLTDLPLIIADRRHSLLGHVCHLPPDVPAHNILQHCVNLSQGRCPARDWKRPPGRPRKTWIQQVEEDHGCTIDSLWSLVQDRSLWRLLWPSLVKRSSEWVKPQTDKINTKPL